MRAVVGFIGLGSNVGDREEHLRAALRSLARAGVGIERVSSVWETEPVDGAGPGWFLNMAARVATDRSPESLLDLMLGIERSRGRARGTRNAPRPLDLDLLLLGEETRDGAALTLPHPRLWRRRFVLAPLAEVGPELVAPGSGRPIAAALAALDDPHAVRRVGALDWMESPPVYSAAP